MNQIKGEEPVASDKLSRIPCPVAVRKSVDIIQLAGEIELDTNAEKESDSKREKEGEEYLQEDSVAQGEVVLLGIEMLGKHQNSNPDCLRLIQ